MSGPTPPGTGDRAAAWPRVPRRARRRPGGSPLAAGATRWMPTSTTAGPRLHVGAGHARAGRPSRRRGRRPRGGGLEVGRARVGELTVGVERPCARAGARAASPTIELRPTTVTRRPASGTSPSRSRFRMPSGVQATKPGSPSARRPTVSGWKPSTSLLAGTASSSSWPASRRAAASGRGSRGCRRGRPARASASKARCCGASAGNASASTSIRRAGGAALTLEVDLRGGVVADRDEREARRRPRGPRARRHGG